MSKDIEVDRGCVEALLTNAFSKLQRIDKITQEDFSGTQHLSEIEKQLLSQELVLLILQLSFLEDS